MCVFSVGKFISTKKCGGLCGVVNAAMDRFDPDRHDVTDGYKFGEGRSYYMRILDRTPTNFTYILIR